MHQTKNSNGSESQAKPITRDLTLFERGRDEKQLSQFNASFYMLAAETFISRGELSKAEHALLKAEGISHQNPKVHYLLGITLICEHQYASAVEEFNQVISLNKKLPEYKKANLSEAHIAKFAATCLMYSNGTTDQAMLVKAERAARHHIQSSKLTEVDIFYLAKNRKSNSINLNLQN